MTREEIIARISKLRTDRKMSARELSLRIDKNESYINRLEYRKDFEPSVQVISDICEACGITLEQFFYYDMDTYQNDQEIIELLKDVSPNKKTAFITILKK